MTTYNLKINNDKSVTETKDGVDVKPNVNKEDEETTREKQIIIDGPLSSIYTQALNIAYAKESIADGSLVGSLDSSTVVDDASLTDPDLYVYVTSNTEIDKEGANKVFSDIALALDKYKDSKKLVVIEANTSNIKSIAALEEYVVSRKVNTSYDRKIAINKILAAIK